MYIPIVCVGITLRTSAFGHCLEDNPEQLDEKKASNNDNNNNNNNSTDKVR